MALIVNTPQPEALLNHIEQAIDARDIRTWSYDSAEDFTMTADKWRDRAWMRPELLPEALKFRFVGNKNIVTSKTLYAVFHGRLTEMLLTRFDDQFTGINATAMPVGDAITTRNNR